ncbi:MAG: hypothetical protein IJ351_01400 [Oscillospiraceae bacterium]|nr:hypothetical protein [Oscillospiraceae bacterium]
MRKIWSKALSVFLALVLVASAVCPTLAATYRPGAQSGPSSSYAGGIYYQNFRRVPITGDNRTDLIAIALSQLGYQEGKANVYFTAADTADVENYGLLLFSEKVTTPTFDTAIAHTEGWYESNGYLGVTTPGIAAEQVDETFYCAAVYTGTDGNTYVSGVISYSLGYYLENRANGTAMPNFAKATGVYAYYAKTLFNA